MSNFRAPELSAPRFRKKSLGFLNKESYNTFIESNPRYNNISINLFKSIITTYNKKLSDAIISSSEGLKLPESLGIIFVASCEKPKKVNPDYRKSAELGSIVNYRNWDSDNHLCKIFYTNYGLEYRLRDREVWSFKASKEFRSRVSNAFKSNHNFYRLVDNRTKISELFRRSRNKRILQKKVGEVPSNYNEFNLD